MELNGITGETLRLCGESSATYNVNRRDAEGAEVRRADEQLPMRLGLCYVKGFREESAQEIVLERAKRPF